MEIQVKTPILAEYRMWLPLQYVAETQIFDIRSIILLGRESRFSFGDTPGPQLVPSGVFPRAELSVDDLRCDEDAVHGDDGVHGGGIEGCLGGFEQLGSNDRSERVPDPVHKGSAKSLEAESKRLTQ
jgi:hypothetical protein